MAKMILAVLPRALADRLRTRIGLDGLDTVSALCRAERNVLCRAACFVPVTAETLTRIGAAFTPAKGS